jgi:Ca2+-binding RTX toxin-like protein
MSDADRKTPSQRQSFSHSNAAARRHTIDAPLHPGVQRQCQFSTNRFRLEDGMAYIVGTNEEDEIIGSEFSDLILGLGEADDIEGLGGDDVIDGGGGDDTIEGGLGADVIFGGSGNDSLRGDDDADLIFGGTGDDEISGGEDDDVLYGENGNDYIGGGGGDDYINGGAGNDELEGFEGNDTIIGGSGINGLNGGEGDDTLTGGSTFDTMTGGAGKDRLTGGGGADTFRYDAFEETGLTAATRDLITDFQKGLDVIDFSSLDANLNTAEIDEDFTLVFGSGSGGSNGVFTGAGAQLIFSFSGNTTVVSGDVNADAAADFSIALSGRINLTAVDFVG